MCEVLPVRLETRLGKGSHARLYFGEKFTTLKDRRKEIGEGLLSAMLRQLGLNRQDLAQPLPKERS